jgi:hypothetical protein
LAVRIKSHWHDEDAKRSMEEVAGAIAFNGWRIAMDKAIHLHGEQFIYENDQQRLAVITEYLIFEIQIVDRMVHEELKPEQRQSLITALAMRLAGHLTDNSRDLLGAGDYQSGFIEHLNQRSLEYAEFNFGSDGPSYPFYRHLGYEIQQIMGASQENRWVIDQVMDMDAPDLYKQLKRIVRNLFI